jgi:hypothetical protein
MGASGGPLVNPALKTVGASCVGFIVGFINPTEKFCAEKEEQQDKEAGH